MLRAVALVLSLSVATTASAAELIPSTWKNNKGSTMQLVLPKIGGGFLGNYTNNAPGYPHCAGVPYPLWGESDGKKINFTVQWSAPFLEDCGSVTTWTGTIKGNVIRAKFVVTRTGKKPVTGKVKFVRQ
ncbi:MAG TPA: avidin/streptavidin family protein [Pseudolabrys sp.]|jgi:hypothetical protein|nr:avidin/streptavidin family protein [Pseudolabrys sp.]